MNDVMSHDLRIAGIDWTCGMWNDRAVSENKSTRRPSRVRETAPADGREPGRPEPMGFSVTVTDRGRLVLPAEVRDRLGIADGDSLTLVLEPDGTIRLLTAAGY